MLDVSGLVAEGQKVLTADRSPMVHHNKRQLATHFPVYGYRASIVNGDA